MSSRQDATPASQTLSRGIRLLEELADARTPLTIDDLATRVGLHRSVAYRLLRTLEAHGLVTRDAAGAVRLGTGLAALAAGVAADLQAEALPELTAAANELGMTCFLVVLDHDECVTLTSVEPRHATTTVAQRPGTRHPVTRGAPGRAILALLPPRRWPDAVDARLAAEVADAAERGWATSHDEVIPTLRAVAVPLSVQGREPAAVAAVHVATDRDDGEIAARLQAAAEAIRRAL
ncbi:IclR family transcriptional regulator [Microbacterium sp. SORGH_AS_0421]|uniref:IclR family transcriptional regulator n=1 Tax=Microbacterium sp. SORGH_AS_0421 TaxID=3041768 RepID=UPI00278DEBB2|nr:helix-turn-helix domain-containing protein [Microbacterium sp. SORGH_AS_0421]MDQ1177046.1 DNA-binding IclR family transcriptional regulator [Microbacterium sp. SORGH_AS_0421]